MLALVIRNVAQLSCQLSPRLLQVSGQPAYMYMTALAVTAYVQFSVAESALQHESDCILNYP